MKNNQPKSGRGGSRPGAGRKAGVPNKLTTQLKDMILGALDQAGGMEYLVTQSEENPTAFMTLVGKVLPLQVNADVKADLTHRVIERRIVDPAN